MQHFSPLALKLREEIEDEEQTYCKNAKFQTVPYGTKFYHWFSGMKFKKKSVYLTFWCPII